MDYAVVQTQFGNPLDKISHGTRQGNTRAQSSQLTEPLWTDPGLKSGISVCVLISTLKKNNNNPKPAGGDRMVQPTPKILASEGKKSHHRHKQAERSIPGESA